VRGSTLLYLVRYLTCASGLNVIAYILIFVFVYETKQERLEKLDSICESKHDNRLRSLLTLL
jgi:hypothetical protein